MSKDGGKRVLDPVSDYGTVSWSVAKERQLRVGPLSPLLFQLSPQGSLWGNKYLLFPSSGILGLQTPSMPCEARLKSDAAQVLHRLQSHSSLGLREEG